MICSQSVTHPTIIRHIITKIYVLENLSEHSLGLPHVLMNMLVFVKTSVAQSGICDGGFGIDINIFCNNKCYFGTNVKCSISTLNIFSPKSMEVFNPRNPLG